MARHAPIPLSHHLCLSRDHAAQPGPTPIGTINPVCAVSTLTLDPGPSDTEFVRVARDFRNMIISRHPLPIFHSFSEGERSARNDLVLFRKYGEKYLAYVQAGPYALSPDVQGDNRKRVTCTDRFTTSRRGMLRELIAAHPSIYHVLSSPTPVTLYRISGERDVFRPQKLR